jgi:hypothetical protein
MGSSQHHTLTQRKLKMKDDLINHPLFKEWVVESVGAIHGTEKLTGKCRLCCRRKKRLIRKTALTTTGEEVKICFNCNKMLRVLAKTTPPEIMDDKEWDKLVRSRARAMTRTLTLYSALINNAPPILISALLKSVFLCLCKDTETKLLLIKTLNIKDEDAND